MKMRLNTLMKNDLRRKKISIFFVACMCIILVVVLWGCNKDGTDSKAGPDETTIVDNDFKDENTSEMLKSDDNYNATTFSDEEKLIYEALFDINNKVTVKIDISKEQMALIQKDYLEYSSNGAKSPIYRMADKVTFIIGSNSYEIEEVGIRMKGNTSRTDFCSNDGSKITNMIHFRLSFDETFDDDKYYGDDAKIWEDLSKRDERKDRTFATLEKLEIKWNKNYDETYIREYYAHMMFRENGVLCPRTNLASTDINSVHMGVYTIFEPVDDLFLEKNLPKEDCGGDLYKAAWTYMGANYTSEVSYGISKDGDGAIYNYDLKTNKKTSEHENLKELISVLNNKPTLEEFESVVDKERWLTFTVVSYFTANPDDMRNNYNNHYVYFLKSSGKAIFIPYDYDRTLGVTQDWDPTGNGLTETSPYSQYAQGAKENQCNPLYKLTVCRGGYYTKEYRQRLLEMAEGKWLDIDNYSGIFSTVKANYANDVNPSQNFSNVNNAKLSFASDVTTKRNNITVSNFFAKIKATMKNKIDDYTPK